MKEVLLAAWLVTASASGMCTEPRTPESKPKKPPAENDRLPPREEMRPGSGMVVEPPVTDTEALKRPPKNVDPEIGEATDDIDDKTRKELQEKAPSR